eukprot:CAMPEP_0194394480 /NCGR_PEP_ID=MMETSP0174-20130528/123878_1 /TAXON_ID=216777 /ORGANISM="Proboscia alata, Strain PI-D3" /LENGTH=488 /DNA_ID=CAMNT_0039190279 /DNA_START=21 /DNA_END=1487 /DNA_ORIENTATION=-
MTTRSVTAFAAAASTSSLPPLINMKEHIPIAKRAMEYFDKSPDPFHVVQASTDMLEKAGFIEIDKVSPYKGLLQPGGKYFFTQNKSTLVAFSVGQKYKPGNGFKIIGAHTDTPNLKVKPRSKRKAEGCIQLGVETYGGGLWHTWFDRDLGISGKILVRAADGSIEQKLVKINRALCRVPTLCIHLQTATEREAFKINKEDHMSPILALEAKNALTGSKDKEEVDGWSANQEPLLLQVLADELEISVNDIADFELNLFDTQPASLGGIHSEFIHSSRMDNHASCFLAVEGLVHHVGVELEEDEDIAMITLFDHEEVGSSSAVGAGSPIMGDAVKRISSALGADSEDMLGATIHNSFVLSCDQAHAVHPNYASKHEKFHKPKMNGGMVIKWNSNQRYATNGVTAFIVREVARKMKLAEPQEFVVRNDCGCGSTIGPIISTNTGIRAVDIGCPSLSMHSIRETMGIADLTNGLNIFKGFFKYFREIDSNIK